MNSEFEKQESIFFEKLGSHSVMTLSTGSGSRISSRTMSVIIYNESFYFAYKAYSGLPSERLIKFTPTLIYSWNYINSKPYMEYFDFENKTYRIESK